MTSTILPEAEADLEQAFDHYEAIKTGLGIEFLDEFRRGLDHSLANPDA